MIADDLRALLEKAIAEQPLLKPLTEEEIRECWSKCAHQAPMAFAHELQKKLGVIKDEF